MIDSHQMRAAGHAIATALSDRIAETEADRDWLRVRLASLAAVALDMETETAQIGEYEPDPALAVRAEVLRECAARIRTELEDAR